MTMEDLTVLVVDDDFRVASVHQAFVERVPGFRVIGQAHSAAEATELGRVLQPDVVLMDIYLPDGDGLEVLRALLSGPRPPTALVISAASDVESVRTALRLGAVHYLAKPFAFAALAERLASIRDAQGRLGDWPAEPTQRDIDEVYARLRSGAPDEALPRTASLAPTLRAVLDALTPEESSSASDVAARVGISRATAQRCLTQLEDSGLVDLRLKYGSTGRPEHRYIRRRR